jgi:hypothetical protein
MNKLYRHEKKFVCTLIGNFFFIFHESHISVRLICKFQFQEIFRALYVDWLK